METRKTISRAEVLRRCHPELERLLNFEAAHPFMNRHGLLTPQLEDELTLPYCTHNKQITTLLQWLPRCGENFLETFMTCLRESAIEVPCPAHRELADKLQQALDEANNYSEDKAENTKEDTDEASCSGASDTRRTPSMVLHVHNHYNIVNYINPQYNPQYNITNNIGTAAEKPQVKHREKRERSESMKQRRRGQYFEKGQEPSYSSEGWRRTSQGLEDSGFYGNPKTASHQECTDQFRPPQRPAGAERTTQRTERVPSFGESKSRVLQPPLSQPQPQPQTPGLTSLESATEETFPHEEDHTSIMRRKGSTRSDRSSGYTSMYIRDSMLLPLEEESHCSSSAELDLELEQMRLQSQSGLPIPESSTLQSGPFHLPIPESSTSREHKTLEANK